MSNRNTYESIDEYAAKLIQVKAQQLIGKAGFTKNDRLDLEQELMIDLLRRMRNFDPAKAKKETFMNRIVEHRISTILEYRYRQCRDWRKCMSLNSIAWVARSDLMARLQFLSTVGTISNHGAETHEQLETEARLDVERVLQSLPADLRELCEDLKSETISEISRKTGIPRTSLYGKLSQLRKIFRNAGLTFF